MRWLRLLMFVAPLAAAGCKQGVNERCQVTSDCDDGLTCSIPQGGTMASGGTCQPTGGTVDMAISGDDLAAAPDLSAAD